MTLSFIKWTLMTKEWKTSNNSQNKNWWCKGKLYTHSHAHTHAHAHAHAQVLLRWRESCPSSCHASLCGFGVLPTYVMYTSVFGVVLICLKHLKLLNNPHNCPIPHFNFFTACKGSCPFHVMSVFIMIWEFGLFTTYALLCRSFPFSSSRLQILWPVGNGQPASLDVHGKVVYLYVTQVNMLRNGRPSRDKDWLTWSCSLVAEWLTHERSDLLALQDSLGCTRRWSLHR